ncbi:MAG TPA: hypothetical protein VF254_07340 [Gammaproteobacteria bacterium]
MRKTDILLVILFIVFVLGLAFGPDLVSKWRADKAADTAPEIDEPAPVDTAPAPARPVDPEVELERVSGLLMLHQACARRFEDFAAKSQPLVEAWKAHHAATLAKREELDFHIVIAAPEGQDAAATAKAGAEELALCEGNLEAMRADLEDAAPPR